MVVLVLMVIVILVVFGLCLGSFINALVWRLHAQSLQTKNKKLNKDHMAKLSIINGRSMCPNCKHQLAGLDLVPLFSWLALRGKCRYCHESISIQYPIVEMLTALLFIASYIWWPETIRDLQVSIFILWLAILVVLIALFIYDLKWLLLPNKLIYPLSAAALAIAVLTIIDSNHPLKAIIDLVLAVAVGGGIFYVLFQLSGGRWIGGGDVRLGWALGLIAGTPSKSVLFIFIASIAGTFFSLPLLLSHRLKRNSIIPFGPMLIFGIVITQLFGSDILSWYQNLFLNF
jgi:leader peptidase (prepilin peptidase)/N-methyltransferase